MNEGAGTQRGHGLEPPSSGMLYVLSVVLLLWLVLVCGRILECLRLNPSASRLLHALRHGLGGSPSPSLAMYPYAEARPSPAMLRFTVIGVVEANAIVDAEHYARLRDFPEMLVEVSECSTSEESCDVSIMEEEETDSDTQPLSRSSSGVETSLLVSTREPQSSWLAEKPEEDPTGGHSVVSTSTEGVRHGGNAVPVRPRNRRWTTPSSTLVQQPGERDPRQTVGPSLAAPMAPPTLMRFVNDRESTSSPSTINRQAVRTIGLEHLAAILAGQRDESGAALPVWCFSEAAVPSSTFASVAPHHNAHHCPAPASPLPLCTRVAAPAAPNASGSPSISTTKSTRAFTEDEEEKDEASPPSFNAPISGSSTEVAQPFGTARKMPRRQRPQITRRGYHRHHLIKGGFLLCTGYVPDIAHRRTRRKQGDTQKKRFVFRLKSAEEYYGSATYISSSSASLPSPSPLSPRLLGSKEIEHGIHE